MDDDFGNIISLSLLLLLSSFLLFLFNFVLYVVSFILNFETNLVTDIFMLEL